MKDFSSLCLKSKYPILLSFYSNLNKFNDINPRKENKSVYDNASELYSDYGEVYFYEYKSLPNAKKVVR